MANSEVINHPAHYGGAENIYEHVKVVEALGWGYAIGSATKYLWRMGRKPGVAQLDDLRKARWWIDHEIQRLECEQAAAPSAGSAMR